MNLSVKAILDANRNSLMLLDLKFSIGTLGIGSGAFICSLYGMNLKNFMEESDLGFAGVTGFAFVFAAIICVYGLHKLRRVQRVSMWGEGGVGGVGVGSSGRRGSLPPPAGRNWRDVVPEKSKKPLKPIASPWSPLGLGNARAEQARLLKEEEEREAEEVMKDEVTPAPVPMMLRKTGAEAIAEDTGPLYGKK